MDFLGISKRRRVRKDATAVKAEQVRLEQLAQEQVRLGTHLYNRLASAAKRNETGHLHNGETAYFGYGNSGEVKPLTVGKIPQNGESYSVVAAWPCSASWTRNFPVLQADIRLHETGKEFHVHYGAYGNDVYYERGNWDKFVYDLEKHVETAKLFIE